MLLVRSACGLFFTLKTQATMENEVLKFSNLNTLKNNENDLGDLVSLMNDCVKNETHYMTAFFIKHLLNEIGLDTLLNVLDCANITAKQKCNSKKFLREFFSKTQTYGK